MRRKFFIFQCCIFFILKCCGKKLSSLNVVYCKLLYLLAHLPKLICFVKTWFCNIYLSSSRNHNHNMYALLIRKKKNSTHSDVADGFFFLSVMSLIIVLYIIKILNTIFSKKWIRQNLRNGQIIMYWSCFYCLVYWVSSDEVLGFGWYYVYEIWRDMRKYS